MSDSILSTPRNFIPGPTDDERIKMAKDGLDVLQDMYRYAESGFESITEDDFLRFKWHGFYRQKPKNAGYFMLRTKIPGGQYNSAQLKAIAEISELYAHGFADITTRQTYQMHWLRVEQIPDIFKRLSTVGITTSGACGDITRNIVGCPVAGIDTEEIIDATPQLMAVNRHLTNNKEFSNLPRKFKISISGCRIHCAQPDINCVGVFGLERTVNGKLEAGFGIKVGGGLSSAPHLAQTLPIFLTPDDVLPAIHYTAVLFRDFGYRERRNHARLKFLVADWGAEKFLSEMERVSGRTFQRHNEFVFPEDPETDHLGVHPQKQAGLYYVGICFAGGRVRSYQIAKIAELALKYCAPGKDLMRNTNKQNLIILNVPEANVEALKAELDANGLVYNPSNIRKGCVSCTGIEFCNLAVAETKNRMMELVGQLEDQCKDFKDKIRIHFSGCPSSCGQQQIADIGFRGAQKTIEGKKVDCYDMFLGGKLGNNAQFNQLVVPKVLASDVHITVGKLLSLFQQGKQGNETFHQWVKRTPKEQIKSALAA